MSREIKTQHRLCRCPVCGRTFHTDVSTRWLWREIQGKLRYPELVCVDCLRERDAQLTRAALENRAAR